MAVILLFSLSRLLLSKCVVRVQLYSSTGQYSLHGERVLFLFPKKKVEGFIGPKNTKKERLKLRLSRLRHSFQKSRTDTTYSQEEGFLYFVSALFILLSNSEGRQS